MEQPDESHGVGPHIPTTNYSKRVTILVKVYESVSEILGLGSYCQTE